VSHGARYRLAVAVAAVFAVGFAAELVGHFGGHASVVRADDLGTLSAATAASCACAVAAWRGDRRDRRGWLLLAVGLACWAFGEGAWAVYELGSGSVPFPSVADAGYLIAIPFIAAGLLAFPSSGRMVARTRAFLDGLIVASALLVLSWITVLGGVYRAGTGSGWDQAITLAYPVGDVVTATMVLTVLARRRRWGGPLALVGVALAIMAISDSLYAWLSQSNAYADGNLLDIGYVVAYLLMALAALRPEPTTPPEPDRRRNAPAAATTPLTAVVIPYALVAAATAAAIGAVIAGRRNDLTLVAAGWVLTVLVLLRQFATVLDNRRLNADLLTKVTELASRERDLERLAFHDPLTTLPNRSLFLHDVRQATRQRHDRPSPLAVMFVDIDDFKTVNDSLGHEAGDHLLVQVADRISRCVREDDTAARLGGDEFGILLHRPNAAENPTAVASRILEAMRPPFHLRGRDITIRASIGITHSRTGREDASELLRQADTAMYVAKNRGKGCYELFENHMSDDVQRRLELQRSLALALSTDQLELHFQPIVDLDTGTVTGAEALARWTHPELGPIPPAEFIALAEQSGLIHDLGRWALLRACEEATRWQSRAGQQLVVGVNLSAIQLHDSGIVDAVAEALHVTGLGPEQLVLEITESVLLRHTERTINRLRSFRAIGVRIAIDDFGTGYSSLSYLPRLPVDIIKIDQSFVRGIEQTSGHALLRGIIELAHSLGLRTIAEGVESERQAVLLRDAGCSAAQGFWLNPPVPPHQLHWSAVPLPAIPAPPAER